MGEGIERPFVSTGHLPREEMVRSLVDEAHRLFKLNTDGAVSSVYPALEQVQPDLFGIAVANVGGAVYASGDAQHEHAIMSVSKPFVFALVCQAIGAETARGKLGVNGTGLPFNSIEAVERSADGRTNPMVNPGAIAATSLAPGATAEDKWSFLHRWPVSVRRARTCSHARCVCLGIGNQSPEPGPRKPGTPAWCALFKPC